MYKKLFVSSFIFLIQFCAFSAHAQDFTKFAKITKNYTDGYWYMFQVEGMSAESAGNKNPNSCQSSTWYSLNINSDKGQRLLSVLLAAQMAGKKVRLWIHSSSCAGQGGVYPNISTLQVSG